MNDTTTRSAAADKVTPSASADSTRLWTIRGDDTVTAHPIHLLLKDGKPIVLGQGRFARVYLGVDGDPQQRAPGDLVAIKFLQRDASAAVTSNYILRFYQEVAKTHEWHKEMGEGAKVVTFHAFGRVGAFSPTATPLLDEVFGLHYSDKPRAPSTKPNLFKNWSLESLNQEFSKNVLDAEWSASLTGDFYAMRLCLISLEELFIIDGSPTEASAASALEDAGIIDAPVTHQIAKMRENVGRLDIKLGARSNGFQDLLALETCLTQANGAKSSTGSLRNAVPFEIGVLCLQLVKSLHEFAVKSKVEVGKFERGLAHRDLKPANILLGFNNPTELVLSDLGFIASVYELKETVRPTLLGSTEEGGVLPAGSRGFRAPEQAENGADVSYIVRSVDEKGAEIAIPSHFGTPPQRGDWLHTQDEKGTKIWKCRMTRVSEEEDAAGTRCFVPVLLEPRGTSLQRGRIIRDVSLHSDVYSLGCIFYYLGSEGRDPERFMQTFVDPITLAMIEATLPKWVVSSPLWMASVLCQQSEEALIADIRGYIESVSVDPSHAEAMIEGIKLSSAADADTVDAARLKVAAVGHRFVNAVRNRFVARDVEGIVNYRRNLRDNKSLGTLLTGKVSREPISFAQLFLTLLCCLRDGESCIVRRSAKVVDDHGQCLEVYDKDAHTYAGSILVIANRLSKLPSLNPDLRKWAELGKSSLEIFMAARLSKSKGTEASSSAVGAPHEDRSVRLEIGQTASAGPG